MNDLQPLPSALIAEKSTLSIVMQRLAIIPQIRADGIDVECFYFPANKTIWTQLCAYREKFPDHEECDIAILIQDSNLNSCLNHMGGASEIVDIWGYAQGVSKLSHWTELLREMKARRIAKRISTDIDSAEDSGEAMALARSAVEELNRTISGKVRSVSMSAATRAFLDKMASDAKAGDIPGVATGIYEIDSASGGARAGELWVIGGKPSSGKSVLMFQIAEHVAKTNNRVAAFSLEMMTSEIIARTISNAGWVDYTVLTQPRLANKGQLEKIQVAATRLLSYPMTIDDSAGQNIDTISSECERIRDSHGPLSLIVVDYIQLIRGGGQRGESREQEVARASGGLKQLAKSMKCPVLIGCQLNEDGKTRESRSIEQDADVMLFIADEGIQVVKMRNGKKDYTMGLTLDGTHQQFSRKS